MKIGAIVKLIFCILLPVGVGGLSAYLSGTADSAWFSALQKPSFNPPAYLFAPVWTVLYILMGIGLFIILQAKESAERTTAIWIFFIQLFFNFWWSLLFFKFHLLVVSVIEIAILWLLIVAMIRAFKKIKPVAAYLQIPYLAWVSFATVLNASISYLNS